MHTGDLHSEREREIKSCRLDLNNQVNVSQLQEEEALFGWRSQSNGCTQLKRLGGNSRIMNTEEFSLDNSQDSRVCKQLI